jgi:diguanylate cyclase (GGDEF)-like protein
MTSSGIDRSGEERAVPDAEITGVILRAFERLERDGAVGELLRAAAEWCGAPRGWALVPSEERDFWVAARSVPAGVESAWDSAGLALPAPGATGFPAGPAGWDQGAPVPLEPSGGAPRGRFVVVPLRSVDGEAPASILVLADAADGCGERLAALARAAEPVLRNARRVAEIRDLTIRDDTADCYNRRHFEEFILEELARSRRFRSALSLIFFDMDNLKEVNSRLGHAMGSRTLLEVSLRVQGRIRRFDKLFRFGGDEFCIVLPETEWHGALEVAQRVREAISARPMLEEPLGEGKGMAMTASFGIASYPLHAASKEDLVQTADRAMQSVKRSSKNGIAVAEMGDASPR